MGCKWANVAPQTDGTPCAECGAKDRRIALLERELLHALTHKGTTLTVTPPVNSVNTATHPVNKPVNTPAPREQPPVNSEQSIPIDRKAYRKQWMREDRERKRLAAQRTKG